MLVARQVGFTLIELMVTVAVVAILASIAFPSYRQHIVRANRSAAEAQMMDIANREQQFLLANRVFADKTALVANGYALDSQVSQNYTWNVQAQATPSFLITFTPTAGQAGDVVLTLDNNGNKTPAEKWK